MQGTNLPISQLQQDLQFQQPKTTLGYETENTKKQLEEKLNTIVNETKQLSSYVTQDKYTLDEKGNRIVNLDVNKQWFFNNINFVFGIGRRFDEDDESNLTQIMKCFDPKPGLTYIANTHFVLSYEDVSVKGLEQWKRTIKDGYYHIILGIINSASEEDLENAPVSTMRKSGVLSVLTSWAEINNYMRWVVSTFGFITDQQVGSDRKKRLPRENMYNINDFTSLMDAKVEDLPKHEEYFEFKTNKKLRMGNSLVTSHRAPDHETVDLRFKKGNDLYSRIRNDKLQTAPPTRIKGVVTKDELYHLPEDNQTPETVIYGMQYYDIPNGVNLYAEVDPMDKATMPIFSQRSQITAGKDAKGNQTRKIVSGANMFPK